jgi:hypothetical protein
MDRAATKHIFAFLKFYILKKKPTTTRDTPIRITKNPLLDQAGLLYIHERFGPTKDLLW